MEPLAPSELFENGACGAWGELYRFPTSPRQSSSPSAFAYLNSDSETDPATTRIRLTVPSFTLEDDLPLDPVERADQQLRALSVFAARVGREVGLPLYQTEGSSGYRDPLGENPVPQDDLSRDVAGLCKDGGGAASSINMWKEVVSVDSREGRGIDPTTFLVKGGALDSRLEWVAQHETSEDERSRDREAEFRVPSRIKGKWRAEVEPDYEFLGRDAIAARISTVSKPAIAVSTEDWMAHNIPLLDDYANRQICPPLGDRVDIKLNDPSQFVTGMLQMMSTQDREIVDPPQLLDSYIDIDRWAHEYLRGRFGQHSIGENVSTLITIVTNNFYEAHVQLLDKIVEKALSNMQYRKGPVLEVVDFALGFDFHMSQEMPFFVTANQRVRNTLETHRPKSPDQPPIQPPITRYGRQTKMTRPAQISAEAEQEKALKTRRKTRVKPVPKEAPLPLEAIDTPDINPLTESASTQGRGRNKAPTRSRAPVRRRDSVSVSEGVKKNETSTNPPSHTTAVIPPPRDLPGIPKPPLSPQLSAQYLTLAESHLTVIGETRISPRRASIPQFVAGGGPKKGLAISSSRFRAPARSNTTNVSETSRSILSNAPQRLNMTSPERPLVLRLPMNSLSRFSTRSSIPHGQDFVDTPGPSPLEPPLTDYNHSGDQHESQRSRKRKRKGD